MKLINEAKEYHEFNEEEKDLFNGLSELMSLKASKEFAKLVQVIIGLLEKMEKGKGKKRTFDEVQKIDLLNTKINRAIEDTATFISQTPANLCEFAYELRKADLEHNDKYSRDLLYGNVKPNALVNILLANEWDSKKEEMKPTKSFRVEIGDYTLQLDPKSPEVPLLGPDYQNDSMNFVLRKGGLLIQANTSAEGHGRN